MYAERLLRGTAVKAACPYFVPFTHSSAVHSHLESWTSVRRFVVAKRVVAWLVVEGGAPKRRSLKRLVQCMTNIWARSKPQSVAGENCEIALACLTAVC